MVGGRRVIDLNGRDKEKFGMDTFGDFLEEKDGEEYLTIHFSPSSVPLRQRWRNTGLSADFLAEYWATFFPAVDPPSQNRQTEVISAIRYIANELLENLMKFSYEPANHPVGLALYLYRDEFRFYASNAIDPQVVEGFQERIQRLLSEEIEKLYWQQIKTNVASEGPGESTLGLLTMRYDYDAHLAWKFETFERKGVGITVVTTMVQLEI
jgi:hypothetical protein